MSVSPQVAKVVKIDARINERLEHLSTLKDRSPHWLMKEAIIRYVEQEEYNETINQETLARWCEAEQGKVVSHAAVDRWLSTWGDDKEQPRPECEK